MIFTFAGRMHLPVVFVVRWGTLWSVWGAVAILAVMLCEIVY
jgi:hypothetical protein